MLWYVSLACLVIGTGMGVFVKRLRPWFVAFGCVGVLVALTLTIVSTLHTIEPKILLVLWPPALAGLANPLTLLDKVLVALFEFGGNFILYGALGTIVGLCVQRRPTAENIS